MFHETNWTLKQSATTCGPQNKQITRRQTRGFMPEWDFEKTLSWFASLIWLTELFLMVTRSCVLHCLVIYNSLYVASAAKLQDLGDAHSQLLIQADSLEQRNITAQNHSLLHEYKHTWSWSHQAAKVHGCCCFMWGEPSVLPSSGGSCQLFHAEMLPVQKHRTETFAFYSLVLLYCRALFRHRWHAGI